MLGKAVKVERPIKRRGTARSSSHVTPSSWSTNPGPKEEKPANSTPLLKPKGDQVGSGTSKGAPTPFNGASNSRNRDRKCFKCQGYGHIQSQCPNQRIMVIRDNGEVATDDESD